MIVWKLDEVMRRKRAKGRELARKLGIGENYLSRVRHEMPDRLSLALLNDLCEELGCEVADLLAYEPGPMPQPEPAPAPKRAAPRKKAPAPAPAAPEPVVEAPAAPKPTVSGGSLAQRRARALEAAPAPEPEKELAPASSEEARAKAMVRTSALQAKLERLKQRRSEPS